MRGVRRPKYGLSRPRLIIRRTVAGLTPITLAVSAIFKQTRCVIRFWLASFWSVTSGPEGSICAFIDPKRAGYKIPPEKTIIGGGSQLWRWLAVIGAVNPGLLFSEAHAT